MFSPSDLCVYGESEFASWMDRCCLEDPKRFQEDETDPLIKILAAKGVDQERKVLQSLCSSVHSFADLSGKSLEHTIEAMKEGVDLIYQAPLSHGCFFGVADFLIRAHGRSYFGDYCYEVWDSKLSRSAKTSALLQLCSYADMLLAIQGSRSESVGLFLGTGKNEKFRVSDYFYYYTTVRDRFLAFQEHFDIENMPHPAQFSCFGSWENVATSIFEKEDSLFQVARITRQQVKRLNVAGIQTMTQLAKSIPGNVHGILKDVHARLINQARLQVSSRGKDRPDFECLPADINKLGRLPILDPGDIFFDMEGYPLDSNGLEYLWGYIYLEKGEPVFDCLWAHSPEEEELAVERFIQYVHDRWLKHPKMHVYHYATYEMTAIKKLAQRYGAHLEKLDDLLRNEVFIDLHDIIRGSLVIGTSSYSIKKVELLYRGKRNNEVTNAMGSVIYYQNWLNLVSTEPESAAKILEDIRLYNKDDCDSTYELAVWLTKQKKLHAIPDREPPDVKPPKPMQPEIAALIKILESKGPTGELMAQILGIEQRELNVSYWEEFRKQSLPFDELYQDPECLAGVLYDGSSPAKVARSFSYRCTFDADQPVEAKHEGKLSKFYICLPEEKVNIEILEIDTSTGTCLLKTTAKCLPACFDLLPRDDRPPSLQTHVIQEVTNYSEGRVHSALEDFFNRSSPRLAKGVTLPKDESETTVEKFIEVVGAMDATSLVVQGPPGAGKTYVGAHAIAAMCLAGKTVGITSNSHSAIDNLLSASAELLSGKGKRVIKIGEYGGKFAVESVKKGNTKGFCLAGGTAWAFSSNEFEGQLDYLFIDEASQLSLDKLVAFAKSTKNFIFLGDQMQLSQPSKANHPGHSGLSCLEYFLQDNATIPLDKGVFLPITRRMHPTLCSLVSDTVYEGRLQPFESTADRFLLPTKANKTIGKTHGVLYIPVEHFGNRQSSQEEAQRVQEIVEELLQMNFQHTIGDVRPMLPKDIVIVAPYNQQVRLLQKTLGDGYRIASVDKFQGQEAPVVIISLGSSSAHDAPRGLDFIFDKNRLNVALSRAQALAIVVGSPALSLTFAHTPQQMSLVNFFCRIIEEGQCR